MTAYARRSAKRFGIVGGLGALAGADLFFKLVKCTPAGGSTQQFDVVIEQHPFPEEAWAGDESADPRPRKLYVYNMIREFERRQVDVVLLPCFISHTFLDELRDEVKLPVADIMEALRDHVAARHPEVRRLGVLTSSYVRRKALFEKRFAASGCEVIYPDPDVQSGCLMPAIYGQSGLKAGHLRDDSIDLLSRACEHLLALGAQLILPGSTEISIVAEALRRRGLPILDANQVYARHAASGGASRTRSFFKVGIIGGVGPAATVDFMDKIIKSTQASRDQDHIKMVVEHNPRIPDRTQALLAEGQDPTIALYSACKKLEADDADIITIPCNTAHAFVERIQPYLSIPIVNMLHETVEQVRRRLEVGQTVGLLATDGTVESRVYHDMAHKAGVNVIVPDAAHQRLVMNAIYGERGVKAGYTDGQCRQDLLAALAHLVERGARVVILGCTELPLIVGEDDNFPVGDAVCAVLDPTAILARKCVGLSRARLEAPQP